MKLYTKTGDDGTTSLFGGQRVDKDSLRVTAYGTVDELNAQLGLCSVACTDEQLRKMLTEIQSRLFDLGADLASPRDGASSEVESSVPRITDAQGVELEPWIDQLWSEPPAMKEFILPGGTELAARLHVARTVCRRAERAAITLSRREPIGHGVVIYLNRLSDLLFAMARVANHRAGVADVPWMARQPRNAPQ